MNKENYQPVAFVDTADLTRVEWLEYRKHGLGASDIPVLMEANDFKSVISLFEEKVSRIPIDELNVMVAERKRREQEKKEKPVYAWTLPDNPWTYITEGKFGDPIIDPNSDFSLAIEVGHALEPVIGKYISCRLGLPVFKDTVMYRHPLYPFLLVDLDFVMLCPDHNTGALNRLVIVECKTATYWKRDTWENGVPYGYELQCRAAMSVFNCDECVIVGLLDNNEESVYIHHIFRDYHIESEIILAAKNFWENHVEKEVLPFPSVTKKSVRREIAEFAFRQDKIDPLAPYEEGLPELASEFERLRKMVDDRKRDLKSVQKELDKVELQLSRYALNHAELVCENVRLRWKASSSRSVDYDGLKDYDPLLYARFVHEKVNMGFEAKLIGDNDNENKEAA